MQKHPYAAGFAPDLAANHSLQHARHLPPKHLDALIRFHHTLQTHLLHHPPYILSFVQDFTQSPQEFKSIQKWADRGVKLYPERRTYPWVGWWMRHKNSDGKSTFINRRYIAWTIYQFATDTKNIAVFLSTVWEVSKPVVAQLRHEKYAVKEDAILMERLAVLWLFRSFVFPANFPAFVELQKDPTFQSLQASDMTLLTRRLRTGHHEELIDCVDTLFNSAGFFQDFMGVFIRSEAYKQHLIASDSKPLYPIPHPGQEVSVPFMRDMYDLVDYYHTLTVMLRDLEDLGVDAVCFDLYVVARQTWMSRLRELWVGWRWFWVVGGVVIIWCVSVWVLVLAIKGSSSCAVAVKAK